MQDLFAALATVRFIAFVVSYVVCFSRFQFIRNGKGESVAAHGTVGVELFFLLMVDPEFKAFCMKVIMTGLAAFKYWAVV